MKLLLLMVYLTKICSIFLIHEPLGLGDKGA